MGGIISEHVMAFERYPKWNPFITSISGETRVDGHLQVRLHPPESCGMTFRPVVVTCTPNQEFRWRGKLGVRGLFDGEHYFQLKPHSNGTTTFIQGERFTGVLVGLLGTALDKTAQGFELINAALKALCEHAK